MAGFRAADAIPMRLRGQVIGALNLFRTETGSLNDDDVLVAQALADVATIAILQHSTPIGRTRPQRSAQPRVQQPHRHRAGQRNDRRTGARRHVSGVPRLRNHSRNHNRRLADVATDIVHGTLEVAALDPPAN